MTSNLTFDRLQTFLRNQENNGQTREKEEGAPTSSLSKGQQDAIKKATHDVYRAHGMMSPMTGLPWKRPISADMYRCPLSESPTTLVVVQEKIVEVPRPRDDDETALHGNLQGKLTNKSMTSEYTRGATGQCRPWKPGGMDSSSPAEEDTDEKKQEHKPATENIYCSPEAIEQSKRVLEVGSKQSWMDGILITSPPGVDFKVGLSYKDVYGCEDHTDTHDTTDFKINEDERQGPSTPNHDLSDQYQGGGSSDQYIGDNFQSSLTAPAIVWDRSYFDDDSLFGSSSSSSSSSGSDSDENDSVSAGEDNKGDDQEDEKTTEKDSDAYNIQTPPIAVPPIGREGDDEVADEGDINDDQVDALLAEFSRAEVRTNSQLTPGSSSGSNNPLRLAERQAQLQNNTTRKSWAHTAPLPIDDFNSWVPNPAMVYPFTLDTFQQQAVARLERSESVFVAAHTSAGKTVVAEYACALAKQRNTRCIYTSPIKALSNQKFRDFCTKFGTQNVGLITGDLQINVDDATCLIMTTEILRSMLYRGADLIRDIEWCIFDEVHYVNDSERGVVWEEVIIMLPSYVNLIFLSATTPNTLEFSDWIGRTKRKPVHVIKTNYRPVPLSHYLWAGSKLHKVMEGRSAFLDLGYREATKALQPKESTKKGTNKGQNSSSSASRGGGKQMAWQAQGSKQNWMSLVRFLEREELTPTVVFSFSKKKCEEIADYLRSLDLNTASERSAVQGFTLQTVARLSPNDSQLPQIVSVCDMVKRGIGIHHGGLLPILKEMVEILFSRNLIKVLFATETFAMGVNMPARAVVFNSIRKHDGTQFRVLEPGEYTQMAGRAGRRGLDKVGTVIMCCFGDEPPPLPILKNMLTGSSTMLRSQFRLTYNMILNLLRVEEMSVEAMIRRSFSEFATQRALTANEYPKLLARGKKTLHKLEEQFKIESSQRVGADDLEDYFHKCSQILASNKSLLSFVMGSVSDSSDNPLLPGRILLISSSRKHRIVHSPAIVLRSLVSSGASATRNAPNKENAMVCLVLLPESYVPEIGVKDGEMKEKGSDGAGGIGHIGFSCHRHYAIYVMTLDNILVVSGLKRKIDPSLLFKENLSTKASLLASTHNSSAFFPSHVNRTGFDNPFAGMKSRGKKHSDDVNSDKVNTRVSSEEQAIEAAIKWLIDAEKEEFDSGLPIMDLRDCVKRGSDELIEFRERCIVTQDLTIQMRSLSSHRHPTIGKYFSLLDRKRTLKERLDSLQHLLSNESLRLFPDFLQRKSVLRTLGYIDESETVCVKGRVACEVNTCEELIVTEMVFEGVLNELEPVEIVAALSALVYQQKGDDNEFDMEIPGTLLACCKQMKKIALNLGQLQKEHGLEVDPADYCEQSLSFGLVHVVYEWAIGLRFVDICSLTSAQEGSIVRCITRLDELCREVRNCARVVGNPTLYRKMEAASVAIKRDIVFASSLYVS